MPQETRPTPPGAHASGDPIRAIVTQAPPLPVHEVWLWLPPERQGYGEFGHPRGPTFRQTQHPPDNPRAAIRRSLRRSPWCMPSWPRSDDGGVAKGHAGPGPAGPLTGKLPTDRRGPPGNGAACEGAAAKSRIRPARCCRPPRPRTAKLQRCSLSSRGQQWCHHRWKECIRHRAGARKPCPSGRGGRIQR